MNWVNESVFYHIYPLGFCGAPQQNSGGEPQNRIAKIIEWLPHFLKLHIDVYKRQATACPAGVKSTRRRSCRFSITSCSA